MSTYLGHPVALHPIGGAQRLSYERVAKQIDQRVDPRCGLCDLEIAEGERTRRVDGERCHRVCPGEEL